MFITVNKLRFIVFYCCPSYYITVKVLCENTHICMYADIMNTMLFKYGKNSEHIKFCFEHM